MRLQTASTRLLTLPLIALTACRGGPSPEVTARTTIHAQIAGDEQGMLTLLARIDSAAAARYYGTDTLRRIWIEGGEPGAVLDSVRIVKTARDTALAEGWLTVPNWERAGGRYDYSDYDTRDRGTDPTVVASLPRVQERREVLLLRESGKWRWRAWLAENTAFRRHEAPAHDQKVPIADRIKHYDSLVVLPQLSPELRTDLTRQRSALAVTDSLTFRYAPTRIFGTRIDVSNASATPLSSLDLLITDADGVEHRVLVVHIPAHGRSFTFESLRLPVRAVRITDADYWNR